ncbi:MAG: hypothetical protein QME12_02185 [Nanoarchaeota archaeon]|nr:hypothetical protein [Nanoarchaeota archaeon]
MADEKLVEKVIRLRPHHVDRLFFRWPFMTEESLRKAHIEDGYSLCHISNMLDVYSRTIEQNQLFIIVPALDDICRACNNPFNVFCENPLADDVEVQNSLAIYFKIPAGKPCLPSDFIRKILAMEKNIWFGYGRPEQYRLMLKLNQHNGGN